MFSAGLNQDQQWVILGERGVSAPVLQNNGSWYYQLYHPGIPDESISVRNIVNSSVQRAHTNYLNRLCSENHHMRRIYGHAASDFSLNVVTSLMQANQCFGQNTISDHPIK